MSRPNGHNQCISILVVDDSEPWRRSVCSMLKTQPDLQVIGEASDGLEATQKAQTLKPDLVLLDIGLPQLNGLEAEKQLCQLVPSATELREQERHFDLVEVLRFQPRLTS